MLNLISWKISKGFFLLIECMCAIQAQTSHRVRRFSQRTTRRRVLQDLHSYAFSMTTLLMRYHINNVWGRAKKIQLRVVESKFTLVSVFVPCLFQKINRIAGALLGGSSVKFQLCIHTLSTWTHSGLIQMESSVCVTIKKCGHGTIPHKPYCWS